MDRVVDCGIPQKERHRPMQDSSWQVRDRRWLGSWVLFDLHALAIADAFPDAEIHGVEPTQADDFKRSLTANERVRLDQPTSICDGLLSYDVGQYNWPILKQHVKDSILVSDDQTIATMKWLYDTHGLLAEPSGAIAIAAGLHADANLDGDGDIVFVLSGRNVDKSTFHNWISAS